MYTSKKIKESSLFLLIVLTILFTSFLIVNPEKAYALGGWGGSEDTDFGWDCCGGGDNGWDGGGLSDGSGLDGGDGVHFVWTPPTPKPSCTINANPKSITEEESVKLYWNSYNATQSVLLANGQVIEIGGRDTLWVTPSEDTTYKLLVSGAGGSSSCKVTVKVNPAPEPEPSCYISANPSTVDYGGSSTLIWSTQNAVTASIDGIGVVSTGSGSYALSNLTYNRTYTMTVTNSEGVSRTCSVNITVNERAPEPSCSLWADPASVSYGNSTTLRWTTNNATSASISDIGTVSTGSGSYSTPALYSSKTYTMTVTNSDGVSRTCSTSVYVQNNPAPTCTLYINPDRVNAGSSATVVWSSSNATSAYITEFGNVSLSGSRTISNITYNKTYTMTVTGFDGQTATCSDTVYVEQEELSCNIWASPNPSSDGNTTLQWTSNGATWAILNNGIGSVSTNGSRYVSGLENGTKVYTLTVGNSYNQTRTCTVTVRVDKYNPPVTTPSCTITASRTYVPKGEGTTLYWSSQNATSAIFADDGSVPMQGSRTVYPTSSGYYKLIVTSSDGTQSSCQTYITVANPATVVTVSSVPYTGPNDAIYVGLMSLVFAGSLFGIYKRRRQVLELINS